MCDVPRIGHTGMLRPLTSESGMCYAPEMGGAVGTPSTQPSGVSTRALDGRRPPSMGQHESYGFLKVSTTAVFLRRLASLTAVNRPVFVSLPT
jgi:hypothetical protein